MNAVRRFAERAIDGAAIIAFIGIFLCVFVQVIFRYVLNSPFTWSEELARYLFIWCAFLGWLIATRRNSHLVVSFLFERMPRRTQLVVAAGFQVATLFFAWILGTRGMTLVVNNWDVENVAVPFNLGVVYLIESIAAIAIAGYAVAALADVLRQFRTTDSRENRR